MPDERYALSFDSDEECIGEVALRLLRMGIDVLYAKTADEALLLAGDAGDLVHAVIVPPTVAIEELKRICGRIEGPREGKPASIVVIGERPDDEVRAGLREAGAEWAVWTPADDSALRFAVNAAMTLPSEIVPRSEPRVPTSLMASFWNDGNRGDAVAYTLSSRGAFLETPRPAPANSELKVEVWLAGAPISTGARVVYVNAPGDGRRVSWPVGMGVVFDGLSDKHQAKLRDYVSEQAASHTL